MISVIKRYLNIQEGTFTLLKNLGKLLRMIMILPVIFKKEKKRTSPKES